ncbi:MAG: aminotransferase class V-fold PLP-dependent enzyme [Phycisphaeraceae bacterium]
MIATTRPEFGATGTLESLSLEDRLDPSESIKLGRYTFKPAQTAIEYAQLHRLNYKTFVRELPQHSDPGGERLVDKFHDRNIYYVALYQDRVVGMISGHGEAPFSVADKLPDPSVLNSLGPRPFEVRLLAIEPEHRHRYVVTGLMWAIFRYAEEQGFSDILISGVAERVRMYEKLGFLPLGPAVASGQVEYVPMVCDIRRMRECVGAIEVRLARRAQGAPEVELPEAEPEVTAMSMMPGPAHLSKKVSDAFIRPMMSHRGLKFAEMFTGIRNRLQDLTGKPAAIFVGSGTLANEVVGQTLIADRSLNRGLMLMNGEFGRRLIHQARRAGLQFSEIGWEYGQSWDLKAVAEALDKDKSINWIWCVHLESSTGMINDVPGLVKLAKERGVKVCLDCVSAVGSVPIDMRDVHLASGVSNKSLGAVAGLSMVFADVDSLDGVDQSRLPAYLDLVDSLRVPGPRFTFPSPPIQALLVALDEYATPQSRDATFKRYAAMGSFIRRELRSLGLPALVGEEQAAPVVTTFSPPAGLNADSFIQRCLDWGYQIGGESGYLRDRNWLQLATMGDVTLDDCQTLFDRLQAWLGNGRH